MTKSSHRKRAHCAAPTLRERAAELKQKTKHLHGPETPAQWATTREAPIDWADPPEGFMAYPPLAPQGFLALELALPKEAQRLYRLADAEFARRCAALEVHPGHVAEARRALRVDELRDAAYGRTMPPAPAHPSVPANVLANALLADLLCLYDAIHGAREALGAVLEQPRTSELAVAAIEAEDTRLAWLQASVVEEVRRREPQGYALEQKAEILVRYAFRCGAFVPNDTRPAALIALVEASEDPAR